MRSGCAGSCRSSSRERPPRSPQRRTPGCATTATSTDRHEDADPAPGRDLPGERLVRPLLRHVPDRPRTPTASRSPRRRTRRAVDGLTPATTRRCREPAASPTSPRATRTVAAGAARQQRERRRGRQPAASSPATRTTTTATSSRRSTAGRWTSSSRASAPAAATPRSARRARPQTGHGLLRRQHVDRALELRAALRDERQLVQHDVRAVGTGRDQPRLGRHRQRRHDAHGQRAVGRDVRSAERRHHARRHRRLLAHERRAAVLGRLLDP